MRQFIRPTPYQRTLVVHLLGKSVQDVFRDDPLVKRWVVALLGVQERPGLGDPRAVAATLGGPPPGMTMDEYWYRIQQANRFPSVLRSAGARSP